MSSESLSRRVYETWHQDVASETAQADRPWHDLIFRYLRPEDISGRRVLEIGCGRGELACRISSMPSGPRRLVAADFAQSAVHLGRKRAEVSHASRLSWVVASMQGIALRGELFDTIVSCETIEHVPDPQGAVNELQRVLRPGGRLLLTTPNYMGPLGGYRGYMRATGRRYTEGGQPICHLTSLPRTILWIRRSGLRVRAVDAVGHYLPWPGRQPIRFPSLDSVRVLRWLALHSIVVAEKS
jgi:2-polyprenyl-3-methyl-5-hydroxy-6-metoxy-1,4-benzoquinol methylase